MDVGQFNGRRMYIGRRLDCRLVILLSNGSSLSYHLVPFELNVTKTFLHCTLLYAVFPKLLFSVLYFLSSILPLLVPLFHLSIYLYADDTQLFYSFYPSDYDSTVTRLQNALEHISSWVTANILTLNSSRTEFLPISTRGDQ